MVMSERVIGKKYIVKNQFYIFQGDIELYDLTGREGLYLRKDGKYCVKKKKEIPKESIIGIVSNNIQYQPPIEIKYFDEEDEDNYLKPIVNDLDEYITRLIKDLIIKKRITRHQLKEKAKILKLDDRLVDNYISTLDKNKMSWNKFVTWLALLGKDYELKIKNI